MTRELSEQEIVEMMSLEFYQKLRKTVYQAMVQSESFKKSSKPLCFSIQTFNVGEGEFLHIESAVKRAAVGEHGFKFTKCILTDDLDFTFDRWNSAKKKFNTPAEFIQYPKP